MNNYGLYYYYNGLKDTTLESQVESYVQSKLTEWGITWILDLDGGGGDFHIFGWNMQSNLSQEQFDELITHIQTNISSNINQY